MCFLTAAATIQFDGSQHVTFTHPGNGVSEAELLNFRFRTAQKQGILFSSRDDTSADRLQIYLGELLLLQFHEKFNEIDSSWNDTFSRTAIDVFKVFILQL